MLQDFKTDKARNIGAAETSPGLHLHCNLQLDDVAVFFYFTFECVFYRHYYLCTSLYVT